MLVAHYIGNHEKDTRLVRAGWYMTKLAQKGPYSHVTHNEAIHEEFSDGTVQIASASIRDNGVRSRRTRLNPAHWMIVDVPHWNIEQSIDLLRKTNGSPYDVRGALATQLPGAPQQGRYFCSQWVCMPYLKAAATFGPHHVCAITLSLGTDVTDTFFGERNK